MRWKQIIPHHIQIRKTSIPGILLGVGVLILSFLLVPKIKRDQALQPVNDVPAIKIIVKEEGVYYLTGKKLGEYGFNINDKENWALVFRGIEIPFWQAESGGAGKIIFYVPRTKSLYTSETILVLYRNKGLLPTPDKFAFLSLGKIDTNSINVGAIHPESEIIGFKYFEEENLYQPQAEGEHWFWTSIVSPGQKKIPFKLNGVVRGGGFIRLRLWSNTEAEANPDHAFRIFINGVQIGEEQWDGKGEHLIEMQIPEGVFRDGENEINFVGIELQGVSIDLNYLDWVEIYYWRKPKAESGRLEFVGTTNIPELGGISNRSWIIDITNPLSPTVPSNNISDMRFQERHVYYVVDERSLSDVSVVTPLQTISSAQMASHFEADFLIISPSDLLPALDPLVEWRRSEGLKVSKQDVSEIYDRYYGYPEPLAIQHFLNDVADQNPNLKYVLLVGDTSYNARLETDSPGLPTFYLQTIFGGQTSSELPFGLKETDYVDYLKEAKTLDLRFAVGRIPASQPKQIEDWVKKVIEFEKRSKTDHPRKIIAVVDPNGDTFPLDATAFLDNWSESYQKEIYAPTMGDTEAPNTILGYFRDDVFLLSYFGHGSIDMWGKDKLFTVQDAMSLSGQKNIPIVIQMTCLTGYYIHPESESLTEALLWNPSGGAIIVIAPSSLTLPNDQEFLTRSWIDAYQNSNEDDRLGDIWKKTLSEVSLNNQGVRDVIATYTFFGDPAMKIP